MESITIYVATNVPPNQAAAVFSGIGQSIGSRGGGIGNRGGFNGDRGGNHNMHRGRGTNFGSQRGQPGGHHGQFSQNGHRGQFSRGGHFGQQGGRYNRGGQVRGGIGNRGGYGGGQYRGQTRGNGTANRGHQGQGSYVETRDCRNCGEIGHLKHSCPYPDTRGQQQRGGRGRGRGYRGNGRGRGGYQPQNYSDDQVTKKATEPMDTEEKETGEEAEKDNLSERDSATTENLDGKPDNNGELGSKADGTSSGTEGKSVKELKPARKQTLHPSTSCIALARRLQQRMSRTTRIWTNRFGKPKPTIFFPRRSVFDGSTGESGAKGGPMAEMTPDEENDVLFGQAAATQ